MGKNEGNNIEPYTLSGDQLFGNIGENEEIFKIDPWENAYVYEYPRSDGHNGYLLFSKGSDKRASFFTELTSTQRRSFDQIIPLVSLVSGMSANIMKNKNKKGFTLIELLVVIAILGVLMGLIDPRFLTF